MSVSERPRLLSSFEAQPGATFSTEVVPLQSIVETPGIPIDLAEFDGFGQENVGSPMANALAGARREISHVLLESRAQRLTEEIRLTSDMHPLRRLFRSPLGELVKPMIESIPVAGDAITFVSAAKGNDVLTGRQLKRWQRWAYAGASILPFVPSVAIIGPIEGGKWLAEEIVHLLHTNDSKSLAKGLLRPRVLLRIIGGFI